MPVLPILAAQSAGGESHVVLDLSVPRFRNWLGHLRLVCGGKDQ